MNVPAGEASSSSAPSSSCSAPIRGIGDIVRMKRSLASSSFIAAVISLGNQPGHSEFTRMPRRAHCRASSRLRLTTAPFEAQ